MILSCHYIIFCNGAALLRLRRGSVHQNNRIYMCITEPRFQYNHTETPSSSHTCLPLGMRRARNNLHMQWSVQRAFSSGEGRDTHAKTLFQVVALGLRRSRPDFWAGEWGGLSGVGVGGHCVSSVAVVVSISIVMRSALISA